MKSYNRGYIQVNLDNIQHNIESMRENLSKDTQLMLVVKADGYGHGAVPVAKELEALSYVWGYGVASVEEAVALRHSGITKPVLVLGAVFPDQYTTVIQENISLNVYSEAMAMELLKVAEGLNTPVHIHIKIDTGMARLGFDCTSKSVECIRCIVNHKYAVADGIFTHFASADDSNKSFTKEQHELFTSVVSDLESIGGTFAMKHCGNSATGIDLPEYGMNMVRVGIAMYGLYPSKEVNHVEVDLRPALSLHSTIASVRELKKGMAVSYGSTYVAEADSRIATVPLGYADGYPRSLSNTGYVLVHGRKAPILGRICMDQMMIDITDIPEADYLSPVTFIGSDGSEHISVEELSDLSGKFNYEFICGLGKRIPRTYARDGIVVEQVDYFSK